MKIKVFYPDINGAIRFSKQELEALLDEVYREGYEDGRKVYPYTWTTPYYTWSNTGNTITSNNTNVTLNATTTGKNDIPFTYTSANADSEITNVNIDLSALKYSEHSIKYEE